MVTSAQFLIDSEANLKGALERLSAPSSSTLKTITVDPSDRQNTMPKTLGQTKMTSSL